MLQIRHVVREIINTRRVFPLCRLIEDNRRIERRQIRLYLHGICRRECRGKARHSNRKDHRQNHHSEEGREQRESALTAQYSTI